MTDSPITILVVDDESSVRKLLRRCFEMETFDVIEADCGKDMMTALEAGSIDLITLDLKLGGEDGLQLAREVRSRFTTPIIMVSGKGDLIDRVVGLELGADDYISKPFELREVLARVRSVLRRTAQSGTSQTETAAPLSTQSKKLKEQARRFHFNNCSLCTRTRELNASDGSLCELTTSEFDLLVIFLQRAHQALNRDQIMDALKGNDWNPNDRTIDNHVARLRKKLEAAGAPRAIKTIRGIGYQFTADVVIEKAST